MRPGSPIRHAMDRFTADPASVRNAAYLMVILILAIVLVGGIVVWVFDSQDFPDLGGALWYSLQTVTTVGYGDKVPTAGIGRVVGATVMIVAVALVAILTASITSTLRRGGATTASRRPRSRGPCVRRGAAPSARRRGRQARRDRIAAEVDGPAADVTSSSEDDA